MKSRLRLDWTSWKGFFFSIFWKEQKYFQLDTPKPTPPEGGEEDKEKGKIPGSPEGDLVPNSPAGSYKMPPFLLLLFFFFNSFQMCWVCFAQSPPDPH